MDVKQHQATDDIEDGLEDIAATLSERLLAQLDEQSELETVAARTLFERILDSCQTMHLLRREAGHRWDVDGMTILRAMYDAFIQLKGLLHEPAERAIRAADYLCFGHIEAEHGRRWMRGSDSDLAEYLRNSPLREKGEPLHAEIIKRLESRFSRKPGTSKEPAPLRRHWYSGDLRLLAKDVGLEDEYLMFMLSGGASVHSSVLHLQHGPPFKSEHQPFLASQFALRAAGEIAQAFRLDLSSDERWMIEQAKRCLTSKPNSKTELGEQEVEPERP